MDIPSQYNTQPLSLEENSTLSCLREKILIYFFLCIQDTNLLVHHVDKFTKWKSFKTITKKTQKINK